MGVRGGVEYGFSSTTTDRKQAVHYAQGKASTILELQMGMVDRGADISWLSQYPHEKETLLPPLMGLQVNGTSVDGGTLVVACRISINMASLTLEQVAGKVPSPTLPPPTLSPPTLHPTLSTTLPPTLPPLLPPLCCLSARSCSAT